jgi:hypothetical protein
VRKTSNRIRKITGGLLAAAAVSVAVAAAPEATAAPQFYRLTVLNTGQVLAVDLSGGVVVTTPQPDNTAKQWELLFPGSAGSSEDGFGSAFQLKNRLTQKCATDAGFNAQVKEATCEKAPAPKSLQLWHHHTAIDKTVNGKPYQFVFNRGSGRVLSRSPQGGFTVPALSSPKATNEASAAAALQLWNLQRL